MLALIVVPSAASADGTICGPGSKAGQCESPQGIATDFETGRLYVADQGNNRIDAFEPNGAFLFAFGWGVDSGASKLEVCTAASTCQAGIAGSGAGQFDHPTSVAVDNNAASASHHDLYVGIDNFHLQKFEPNGTFLKSFGAQGKGECQISNESGQIEADQIGVGPSGDVYLADVYRIGTLASEGFVNRVERFDPAGNCLGEVTLFQAVSVIGGFAVDSSGNVYVFVTGKGAIFKYDGSGALVKQFELLETSGLAIDGSDHLFARQRGDRVATPGLDSFFTEYDPSGAIVRRFGYAEGALYGSPRIAIYPSTGGDLFVSEETFRESKPIPDEVRYLSFPPPGPVIFPEACKLKENGNTKATLLAEVNPEGKATTAHFEYLTEADYQANGNSFSGANPASLTPESESIGSDFTLHAALGEASVEPETEYRCRVVATNADAPAGVKGQEGSLTSLPPLEIGATTVSDVGPEEATLNAQVNPLGIETTGYFEYVEDSVYRQDAEELGPGHGFDHATKVPNPPAEEAIDFGAGKGFKVGSATVKGLKPGTAYRYRIVATNPFFEENGEVGVLGPARFFRTFGALTGSLPDDRAWELVSPAQKNSAEVGAPGNRAGLAELRRTLFQAGAPDGEAVTYTSWTSFGEAEGASWASQYLSRRTAGGWATENISPFGTVNNLTWPPYVGFSADLRFGSFKTTQPSLTADCRNSAPAGVFPENLYLRDNQTGELRCLDPDVSGGPEGTACLIYAGSSNDGSLTFLAGTPEGGEAFTYSLYESSAANGPQLVSVLPDGEPAPATAATSFGRLTNNDNPIRNGLETCQVGQTILRHVVSEDGSRAFWTYAPEDKKEPSRLFVRVDGNETLQLDAHQSGAGTEAGEGAFAAASADGSVAYFTDVKKLVSGAHPEKGAADLYRYELGQPTPLSDLTKGPGPGEVKGVVGTSDDGSYVYFVAGAALSGTEANEAGQKAVEGANNLYLFHEGETRFIGRLAGADDNDWTAVPRELSARVTPDGRHLAFSSVEGESLAGYDNTIASGEHCHYVRSGNEKSVLTGGPLCSQVFLYDAESGKLTCASCNPSGSRPLGPAVLPAWANPLEGPRYLSNDGQRLFFSSFDRLSPADENDKLDIYEFEHAGTGGCTAEAPAYDSTSGGCHFLISSGKSGDESFLIDASADGRDVFFSTRDSLVGWDVDENFDIYDARAGGGFPEPQAEHICQGEGCLTSAARPPAFVSPPRFEGAGNPVTKTKDTSRGHRKKHGKKRKKGHGKSGNKARAGR